MAGRPERICQSPRLAGNCGRPELDLVLAGRAGGRLGRSLRAAAFHMASCWRLQRARRAALRSCAPRRTKRRRSPALVNIVNILVGVITREHAASPGSRDSAHCVVEGGAVLTTAIPPRLYLLRLYIHGTASSRAARYCSRRRQPSSASTPAMPTWLGLGLGPSLGLGLESGLGLGLGSGVRLGVRVKVRVRIRVGG